MSVTLTPNYGIAKSSLRPSKGSWRSYGSRIGCITLLLRGALHPAEVCDPLKMYNSVQLPRTKTVIARSRLMGDILEMPDGPAQIELDRQLCHDTPKNGFTFAWADPDLQNLLWS